MFRAWSSEGFSSVFLFSPQTFSCSFMPALWRGFFLTLCGSSLNNGRLMVGLGRNSLLCRSSLSLVKFCIPWEGLSQNSCSSSLDSQTLPCSSWSWPGVFCFSFSGRRHLLGIGVGPWAQDLFLPSSQGFFFPFTSFTSHKVSFACNLGQHGYQSLPSLWFAG